MSIAIYTIFRCTNYGAVLQAYALARVLRTMAGDANVAVLNHWMDSRDTHLLGKITNPNTPWFQRWRNQRKFKARYFQPDFFELRRQKTIRFIDEHIRPTKRVYRNPESFAQMPAYDTVIVGSDQVWNPVLNHDFGCNPYLTFNFPELQDRVSYAASFGVASLPQEYRESYAEALGKFRRITVREESGARLCNELLGQDITIPVVLDPTLLLTDVEWREGVSHACAKSEFLEEPYLVAYWVRSVTSADICALQRIAQREKCVIRLLSAGPLPKMEYPQDIIPYVDAAPFDFVAVFSNAKAVVTDSFHGLQFATIFHKPFLALADLSSTSSNAARLTDFCARYGLQDGVKDIVRFQAGTSLDFACFPQGDVLHADRVRSLEILKGLLP